MQLAFSVQNYLMSGIYANLLIDKTIEMIDAEWIANVP